MKQVSQHHRNYPSLKEIVEEVDTAQGKIFDLCVQALIILSLVCFSIETLPGLSAGVIWHLNLIEYCVVVLFSIEYLLRCYVAKPKLGYIFSFYGLVDLLSIAPFYLFTGTDSRYFRALRLLRLIRTLKLVRYNKASRRMHRALLIAKEEIILFFGVTFLLLFFSSVGLYYFEHDAQPELFASIFHSGWTATISLTTLGYGESYAITTGGRIFTVFILLIGLGVVAAPAGILASALAAAREMEEDE